MKEDSCAAAVLVALCLTGCANSANIASAPKTGYASRADVGIEFDEVVAQDGWIKELRFVAKNRGHMPADKACFNLSKIGQTKVGPPVRECVENMLPGQSNEILFSISLPILAKQESWVEIEVWVYQRQQKQRRTWRFRIPEKNQDRRK